MTRTRCPIHNRPARPVGFYLPRIGIDRFIPSCSDACLNEIARNPHRYRLQTPQAVKG